MARMLEKTCPCGAIKQINQIGTSFSDESAFYVKFLINFSF
jgi:hypothetical protein